MTFITTRIHWKQVNNQSTLVLPKKNYLLFFVDKQSPCIFEEDGKKLGSNDYNNGSSTTCKWNTNLNARLKIEYGLSCNVHTDYDSKGNDLYKSILA